MPGLPEHAERVRPSRRKPGQTADSDAEESGAALDNLSSPAQSGPVVPERQS